MSEEDLFQDFNIVVFDSYKLKNMIDINTEYNGSSK